MDILKIDNPLYLSEKVKFGVFIVVIIYFIIDNFQNTMWVSTCA